MVRKNRNYWGHVKLEGNLKTSPTTYNPVQWSHFREATFQKYQQQSAKGIGVTQESCSPQHRQRQRTQKTQVCVSEQLQWCVHVTGGVWSQTMKWWIRQCPGEGTKTAYRTWASTLEYVHIAGVIKAQVKWEDVHEWEQQRLSKVTGNTQGWLLQ